MIPLDQQNSLLSPFGWKDRFELVERIGKGAMGQVWKAWEKDPARWVALKLLVSHRVGDLSAVARVEAEGITLMRLTADGQHPNVVPIFDFAATDEHACLVMKFIPGKTLAATTAETALDVPSSVALIAKIAHASGWFHRLGIVHRDLKPENILLHEENGEPVILDFSIAKDEEALMSLTTDQDLGTAAYMAPEQFGVMREKVSPAADVYALGAMLYELVTGALPFPGDYLEILSCKLAGERPQLPRLLRPELPRALERIIWKAMAPSVAERYGDGQAMADDLQRFLAGKSVEAPSGPRLVFLSQFFQRHWILLLIFAACLSGGLSGWFSWPLLGYQNLAVETLSASKDVQPAPLDLSLPADDGTFQVEAGFTDLFSPEKLPFWKDDDRGGFHFADGVATSWTEEVDPKEGLWVFTEVAFSDFVLRLQFLADEPRTNSGLFLRCQAMPNGFLREACQVQIGRFPTSVPTGSIFYRQQAKELPLRGKGQWNDLEIIAQGSKYYISLNGVRVNVFDGQKTEVGYLALQNHMNGVVQFRRVRIRPLKQPKKLPLAETVTERLERDYRRQTGRLIPGIDDVFPPLVGSWRVAFQSGQVRHYRIHADGRMRVVELGGQIVFLEAREGKAFLDEGKGTLARFSLINGALQVERWNPSSLLGTSPPTDSGQGVKIKDAEVDEIEVRLNEFTQVLRGNRWLYQDQGYPSSEVRFGTDGRFHDRWRWRYWIIKPGVIHVQYSESPYDPEEAVTLTFDSEYKSYQGQFTDPNGRTHWLSGKRL